MSKSSQNTGQHNEERLLAMLKEMESNGEPFPVNRKGGLYVKALWSRLSGQPLEEVAKAPSWFNGREGCKKALEDIKKRLAKRELEQEVVAGSSAKDKALDELLDSSSDKALQIMKGQLNNLKEKLESERAEKVDLHKSLHQLKDQISQMKLREEMIVRGKIPH